MAKSKDKFKDEAICRELIEELIAIEKTFGLDVWDKVQLYHTQLCAMLEEAGYSNVENDFSAFAAKLGLEMRE